MGSWNVKDHMLLPGRGRLRGVWANGHREAFCNKYTCPSNWGIRSN
jgi:hypothetical protein